MMSHRNGPQNLHYHNAIKSTSTSAVYTPSSNIISAPLTDKYTVGENIGRGKFAVVRKCTNKLTNEVAAAKFIKKRRRGKSCREEILREVVMLEMALEHPRLVNLKEVYETQQELILITEYCAGGELFTECILEEKFDESDVRQIMTQILEGMAFLHDKNIVHLDLKPQNILLTDEFPKGSIKICDLGFACLVNTGEDIRDIIGTPDYVAPEVLNYDPLGLYTDMWSLGVLTYVMLTTCSPFAGDDKQMTFSNITTVNLDFPDDLFGDISLDAQDFIKKLLIAEPSERMTAKECFSHKWISGVVSPLSINSVKTPNLTSGDETSEEKNETENKDVTSIEWEEKSVEGFEESSRESSRDDLNTDGDTLRLSKQSSRDKIANQCSEMSVTEGKEDEVGIDTETDFEALSQNEIESNANNENARINTEINDTVGEVSEEKIDSGKSFVNEEAENSNLDLVSNEITNEKVMLTSFQDVNSPETDSSMCLSDKIQETDSGLVTGSESKSTESINTSGRVSADRDDSENIETDFISEVNDDAEMLNKSSGEVKNDTDEDVSKSVNTVMDKTESSRNEHASNSDVHEEINEIDEMMDTETQSCMDNKVLQMNENNSARSMINEMEHSSYTYKFSTFENSQMSVDESSGNSSFTKDQPRDQEVNSNFHTSFGDFIKDDKYAISETRGRNSVGGIDDSINSMQLGERHKRGMCNDSSFSGAENSANDETEYEFVSVSKRVRSYEDTLASRSPPFSPKIPRSPRVPRHSRNYHHQHH